MTYTATTWKANNEPVDDQGSYVQIEGRGSGVGALVMSWLQLAPRVRLIVNGEAIHLRETKFTRQQHRILPLENVCSTYYGYHRPLLYALVLWIVQTMIYVSIGLKIQGEAMATIGAIVALGLAVLYFFLNKELVLGFVEHSGVVNGIGFKGSLANSLVVDEKSAAYVMQLTQALVDARVTARAVVNPPEN